MKLPTHVRYLPGGSRHGIYGGRPRAVAGGDAIVVPSYAGANAPAWGTIRALNNGSPNRHRSFEIERGGVGYLVTLRAGGRRQADLPAVNAVNMHLSINPGAPVAGSDSDFHIVADGGGGQSVAWHFQVRCGAGGTHCNLANTRFDSRGNGVWWTGLGGTADDLAEAATGFAEAFLESFNDDNQCGENPNCP